MKINQQGYQDDQDRVSCTEGRLCKRHQQEDEGRQEGELHRCAISIAQHENRRHDRHGRPWKKRAQRSSGDRDQQTAEHAVGAYANPDHKKAQERGQRLQYRCEPVFIFDVKLL